MKFICSSNNFKNLHIELPKETMVQSIPQDEDYDSDDTRNNSIGELQNVAEHNLAAMQVQEKVYKHLIFEKFKFSTYVIYSGDYWIRPWKAPINRIRI